MTEFNAIMSGPGDRDDWVFGSASAVIYEMMSVLDRCLDDDNLTPFSQRVEALVLLTPPPLHLLSELIDVMRDRRRELRQREFDAHRELISLIESCVSRGKIRALDDLAAAVEVIDDEDRDLHDCEHLIADARRACDRAEHSLSLLDMAIEIVSDWLRGLSASAWRSAGEPEAPPGDLRSTQPPRTH